MSDSPNDAPNKTRERTAAPVLRSTPGGSSVVRRALHRSDQRLSLSSSVGHCMRKLAMVSLLAGGATGILVLLLANWSGPREPVLLVTFQGHTNLHDGSRAVVLCLSNCTRRVVDRQSSYDVVFRNEGDYSTTLTNLPSNRLLSAGEAEMLVIPVPSGSGSWCARFVFRHIPSGLEKRLISLQRTAEDWGLPIRYREIMYPVESGWMER